LRGAAAGRFFSGPRASSFIVPPSLEILHHGDEATHSFQLVAILNMVRKKTTGHHTVKRRVFDLSGFDPVQSKSHYYRNPE
jgi:hypothetical protein